MTTKSNDLIHVVDEVAAVQFGIFIRYKINTYATYVHILDMHTYPSPKAADSPYNPSA